MSGQLECSMSYITGYFSLIGCVFWFIVYLAVCPGVTILFPYLKLALISVESFVELISCKKVLIRTSICNFP